MDGPIIGMVSGTATALILSGVATWTLPGSTKPWLRTNAAGIALVSGLLVAFVATLLTGGGFSLVTLSILFALVAGVITAFLEYHGTHILWRGLALLAVTAAAMWYLYWRGDIHAVPAGASALCGVVVINVCSFATRATASSGALRVVPGIVALNAIYVLLVASRLPNPGLATVALFVLAAAVPTAFAKGAGNLFGPVIGGLAWMTGFYVWLANASIAVALAPIVIVLADVVWTLIRRLAPGNRGYHPPVAVSWWQRVNAYTLPATDLVAQRMVTAASARVATLAFVSANVLCLIVASATWYLSMSAKLAAAAIVVLAVLWIIAASRIAGRPPKVKPRRSM